MHESGLAAFILTLISATGYVAATYFMKLWDQMDAFPVIVLIAAALIVAVVSEIIVLKHGNMGEVYIIIIGLECLMVAMFARLVLNESYSVNELIGMVLIIGGIAMFQLPDWSSEAAAKADAAKSDLIGQVPVRAAKADRLAGNI